MTDQSVARVSEITGRSELESRAVITDMNASGRLVDPEAIGTDPALAGGGPEFGVFQDGWVLAFEFPRQEKR